MDVINNTLMLGLKVQSIRVGYFCEYLASTRRNCINEGRGFQLDTKELANKCKEVNKDISIIFHT